MLAGNGVAIAAPTAQQTFEGGVDISMLPVIEKAGGIYRDDSKPKDAIAIFRAHGFALFRVRLFVNPNTQYQHSDGAVQDLKFVEALGKRIKSADGTFLLDIHYSDTWADPGKQFTPKAWVNLDFASLKQRVGDYTTSVLSDLHDHAAMPDMVQVGNEITAGILWPTGKVLDVEPGLEDQAWQHFSDLFDAGALAVRKSPGGEKIGIVIHIHGGGKPGMAKYFFTHFKAPPADYDIVGMSFYPAWGDSFDELKTNIDYVASTLDKDFFVAETSYPWRQMDTNQADDIMRWPMTPAGQKQFLEDLCRAIQAAPRHHGLGFSWWYPEAIPTPGMRIWRNGAEGLFDANGNALPALTQFNPAPQ